MSAKYAVFGHPASHSLSPRIHAAFAAQFDQRLDYAIIDAAPDQLRDALERFAAAGGRGANITVPHKVAAFELCSEVTERARRAGAANVLTRVGDTWHGDNTDGAGLVRDLTGRRRLDLRGRHVLLLGAGGAARGVAVAMLDAGVRRITIVNRTPANADALVDTLDAPDHVGSRYWKDMRDIGDFELIINTTSAGRGGDVLDLPSSLVNTLTTAVDISYGEVAIGFLSWARAAGCRHAFDGLGMLVEQAALAYQHWHGKRPDTDEVFADLQSHSVEFASGD